MKTTITIFNDLSPDVQTQVTESIAAYTQGKLGETPQMLPVQPCDITSKYAGVVALQANEFAGYIGANNSELHRGSYMSEVGSLWVPNQFRKQGIAHKLVAAVSEELDCSGILGYAFCNALSKRIFLQSGYAVVPATEVPPSALGLCATCPMLPVSGGCCDEIVLYRGGSDE